MNYESGFETGEVQAVELESDGDLPRSRFGLSGRTRLIVIGLLVLLAAIVAYAMLKGGDAAAPADTDSQVPSVTVIAPGRTTIEGEIIATGSLAARRDMPVSAVGEGGRVVSVPVDAGDWVRQGQVLAVIDRSVQSQQAQSSAAQIQVAQADANLAQANLERALKLVERGFVSTADVDRLTATRDAANARVRVAQAQLRELQARNARLNIVAPAAGLVLERNVEPGQTVSGGGQSLFRIARGGEMELLARLGETDLARISAGVTAEVTPAGSDKTFTGQVWQVSPIISTQDRQGTARVALSYAPSLRPGGFATAVIKSGTVTAPILPESALLSDDKGSFVFVVGKDNKVERRDITLGPVTSEGVVILDGLNGTERIVLRAGGFLNPGEAVKPVRDAG